MLGSDPTLFWAVVLLLLGVVCLVLEMFLPSAGTLGLLSALSFIAAVVLGFTAGPRSGIAMTLAVTFIVPLFLAAAVRYWPHTPLGKMILLQRPRHDEVLPRTDAYRTHRTLVGKYGHAQSHLLPSGVVSIEGKTYDAVSHGLPIDAGQSVRVVGLDTQRLVVRAETPPGSAYDPSAAAGTAKNVDAPAESQGIEDPFA